MMSPSRNSAARGLVTIKSVEGRSMVRAAAPIGFAVSLLACASDSAPAREVATVTVPPSPHTARPARTPVPAVHTREIAAVWTTFAAAWNAGEFAEFLRPEWGLFGVWRYGEHRVIARFDDLDELTEAGTGEPLTLLNTLSLPARMQHAPEPVRCAAAAATERAYLVASPPPLEPIYAALRAASVVPDKVGPDEDIAREADEMTRLGVYVEPPGVTFHFVRFNGDWRWVAVDAAEVCAAAPEALP